MRDVARIGAGVALGVGLLVLAGAGRDTPVQRAPAIEDADDVEAPVPPAAAPASPTPAPSAPAQPPAPALPHTRAGWQAGAHPPEEVTPAVVVRAARRGEPRACTQPPPGSAGPSDAPGAAACAAEQARQGSDPRPAVEIQWNAPGSTR